MEKLKEQTEVKGIMNALSGEFIRPVPGGDLIRSPDIIPTGRNIHAFDPFRMPSLFAMKEGEQHAELLLSKHETYPNSIAMVLWGSDNIKSDGLSIAQAMALMGAVPRFDDYGRLCGAELVPLSDLGRPRIDVLITLSGIFRDLLPLQVRMLASAAYKASLVEEPLDMNYIKANTLKHQKEMNIDIKAAALRVFSNAEGAYGSNVSHLIDTSSWDNEEELADTFNNRKGFAYGLDGKCTKQSELLSSALKKVDFAYQNLEIVELGVTTIDHYFDTLGGISRAVKKANGGDAIPVYIGDQTRGDAAVRTLSEQINLETIPRLYQKARPGAKYEWSLELLKSYKARQPKVITKSGLMLGLGEKISEVKEVLTDLKAHDVDMVTLGQYLQPSKHHLRVERFVHPTEFEELRSFGEEIGFMHVASGPLVRSSYHADKDFRKLQISVDQITRRSERVRNLEFENKIGIDK